MLHQDHLYVLNQSSDLLAKLVQLHHLLSKQHPQISRVAIALYDKATDDVKTFIYSGKESPLNHYQAKLADCYSLSQLVLQKQPRVENNLAVFLQSEHQHASEIYRAGYRSSYTLPLYWDDQLLGFLFFNAEVEHAFQESILYELDMLGHLICLMLVNELSNVRTLSATIRSALDLTHFRDPETGQHLDRMSRYARIIAVKTANQFGLSDHFIEHLFMFAPLHDLGKIAIPDEILLKNGPLTPDEFKIMQTHSAAGLALTDKLLANYGLNGVSHIDVLRNIILHHHEAWDGSGYPVGLKGEAIPVEARIVTVADVFDALTSERPYKSAWSNERAFTHLRELAGIKLDPLCVEALLTAEKQILDIQRCFKEQKFG